MNDVALTSERQILLSYIERGEPFPTGVTRLREPKYGNPKSWEELGEFREFDKRKSVTTDMEVIQRLNEEGKEIPGFLEAGPRDKLAFGAQAEHFVGVKAAVVTSGGLAPGLNSVVHSIVERHLKTYFSLVGSGGGVWGFYESFKGLVGERPNWKKLEPGDTERLLGRGGSDLGAIRYTDLELAQLASTIAYNLERWRVDILYVIGGDGSLTTAHEIAMGAKRTVVVGIPKTMDNDILWVWQSFGFNTAVERAAGFIDTMRCEAESTRRVCILELFGARAGFVAANAALASGHVDLVMIPEAFEGLNMNECESALERYVEHVAEAIARRTENPHAVVVIAEGVGNRLAECGAAIDGRQVVPKGFSQQFRDHLAKTANGRGGGAMGVFVVEPRYYVRAVPANAHDQIYCKRLGALAVDNALAGYTDFMISQWNTEYVLVPLALVARRQKHIPPGGMFWKQVVASTGQPIIQLQRSAKGSSEVGP